VGVHGNEPADKGSDEADILTTKKVKVNVPSRIAKQA
jgi:hypothetical protein